MRSVTLYQILWCKLDIEAALILCLIIICGELILRHLKEKAQRLEYDASAECLEDMDNWQREKSLARIEKKTSIRSEMQQDR